ncbi:MAG TPA: nicotinate phosphoribosyltransferase, partial [Alcanivorax sp.]|nr:nicotinate phosphoribosyltransferase [Alcanivorax sp.]
GDLGELAGEARRKLDAAGLQRVRIVVSGGLDEHRIQALVEAGAPIDGFGVGTEMGSVADAPSLDFAYKLTEYQGRPRLKTSPGKPLYPGAKQVWRFSDGDGGCRYDEITGRDEARDGVPLLRPVVANGEAVAPLPDPDQARQRLRDQLASLPAAVRSLAPVAEPGDVYPVRISEALEVLRRDTVSALD